MLIILYIAFNLKKDSMPISNQIFEHFRKQEREKQKWIQKLKKEGYIVIKKTEHYEKKTIQE